MKIDHPNVYLPVIEPGRARVRFWGEGPGNKQFHSRIDAERWADECAKTPLPDMLQPRQGPQKFFARPNIRLHSRETQPWDFLSIADRKKWIERFGVIANILEDDAIRHHETKYLDSLINGGRLRLSLNWVHTTAWIQLDTTIVHITTRPSLARDLQLVVTELLGVRRITAALQDNDVLGPTIVAPAGIPA